MKDAGEIVEAVLALVSEIAPDAGTRTMYGGTVIEMEPGVAKTRIGGVYVYADHVSVEFAKGAAFDDSAGVLEGSGKARRHVKLRQIEDIEASGCRALLVQAVSFAG